MSVVSFSKNASFPKRLWHRVGWGVKLNKKICIGNHMISSAIWNK